MWEYKCPKCGQRDRLYVVGLTWYEFDEDGAVPTKKFGSDIEWGEKSLARCPECDHEGRLGEFYCEDEGPEQEKETE